MSENEQEILFVHRMIHPEKGAAEQSLHLMFSDGSQLRMQLQSDPSAQMDRGSSSAAALLLEEILALLEKIPRAEEEAFPICLGDTTCMYCGGAGCPNCRRA